MKTAALVAAVSLMWFDGCRQQPTDSPAVTAEIAAQTAYAVVKSRKTFSPSPAAKCCEKCTNGKVRSGDGIAWVPCPCPATCKCKAKP